jgi:hypothetical protein
MGPWVSLMDGIQGSNGVLMTDTELVKRQRMPGDKVPPGLSPLGEWPTDEFTWDYPPPYFEPMSAKQKLRMAANRPDSARFRDVEPIVLNEACGKWDFGDQSTWLLILGMFLLGLAVAVSAYLLPHGRDMYVPPIKVF